MISCTTKLDQVAERCECIVMQAEMAGSPDLAPILEMLNATRASARERQGEIERKIRAEARKLRQGDAAGQHDKIIPLRQQSCWHASIQQRVCLEGCRSLPSRDFACAVAWLRP